MSIGEALPPDRALVGTKYRTYKRATQRLADWLASTAQKLGTQVDQKTAAPCGLGISMFTKLTNLIINAKPRVEVPLDVIDVAEKAFFARQERADLLQGADLDSDVRHQYFVTILGEVCEKLKTHYHASRKREKKDSAQKDSTEQAKSAPSFEMLSLDPLESCSESEIDQSQIISAHDPRAKSGNNIKKKKKKKPKRASPFIEEEEDPYFVLMCLLSDLKAMRKYAKEIWQEYKDGKTDLITVSLTTNAFFDIIRTYEVDFPAISSLLADYARTMELMLSRKLGKSDEGLALFLHPKTGRDEYKEADVQKVAASLAKIPRLAELTFASAFYFLRGPRHMIVRRVKKSKKVTIDIIPLSEDRFSTFRLGQDNVYATDTIDSFRRDLRALAHFARTFYDHIGLCGLVTLDHISLQWRDDLTVDSDEVINLAQVFGAQMYLDIHNVLGRDCKRGFEDLCEASERIAKSIDQWKQNKLTNIDGKAYLAHEHNLKKVESVIEAALCRKDLAYFKRTATQMIRPKGQDSDLTALMFKLLSPMELHPLQCGTILFQMIHPLRDSGLAFAQRFSTVKFAGQFYFQCQMHREHYRFAPQFGFKNHISQFDLPLRWDDMDYLFQLLGKGAFFSGQVPQKNHDFVALLLGAAKSRAQIGQKGPICTAPQPGRVLFAKDLIYSYEPIAVTHRLFFSKYADFSGRDCGIYKWTLETLQNLLENHLGDVGQQVKDCGEALSPNKAREGEITQVLILRRLKQALQSESRALHFDFLSFHITCLQLFRKIRDDNRQFFSIAPDKRYPADDYNDMHRLFDDLMIGINSFRPEPKWQPLCLYDGPMGNGTGSTDTDDGTALSTFKAVMTNEMHVSIDSSLQCFLDYDGKHDKEMKKLAKIRGLSTS